MNRRIFCFDLNGRLVLGFDTGLSAQDFARAKMAQLITQSGAIVYPDGKVETWQPEGTTEDKGTMIVWGPFFPGTALNGIVNFNENDAALDAFRFWFKARKAIEESSRSKDDSPLNSPAGALIAYQKNDANEQQPEPKYPQGTVFFPPARLLRRCIEAEGSAAQLDAERWAHPDLNGSDSLSFSAGVMLYRIFCGTSPFPGDNRDETLRNIREGVFIPPNLAAPGLDPQMSQIISGALCRIHQEKNLKQRPSPNAIADCIGPPFSRNVSSWIKPLSDEETNKIKNEQEQYSKKKTRAVKTRRFISRNTTIIAVSIAAIIALILFVRGTIRHRSELPTTKGMTPVEVAEAYYGAFGDLDHTLMDACVTGKAGKEDIAMVMNLFVISRVRQAYEMLKDNFISAQEWIEEGRPATDRTVFGITDLVINVISESGGEVSLTAEYILWMPGTYLQEDASTADKPDEEEFAILPPVSISTRDSLELKLIKNTWRISQINRISNPLK